MNFKPKFASEIRSKPLHIKNTCPKCQANLILAYKVLNPKAKEQDIFYDEWICPTCPERTCYLDWPNEDESEIIIADL